MNTKIYERTTGDSYERVGRNLCVQTDLGVQVKAKFIVFACNAYIGTLSSLISRFIMPVEIYMIATEPLDKSTARQMNRDDVAVFDFRFSLDFYRLSADRRLVFGGGEKYLPSPTKDITKVVRPRMLKVYPKLRDTRIDYAWSGKIAITLNRLPSVGQLEENVYFAQGFSGHGVAMTNLVGKLLTEMIMGVDERYKLLAKISHSRFPGGRYLRWLIHILGMSYYAFADRVATLTNHVGQRKFF